MIDFVSIYKSLCEKYPFPPEEKPEEKNSSWFKSKFTDEQREAVITAALGKRKKDEAIKAVCAWIPIPMGYRELGKKLISIQKLPERPPTYSLDKNHD
jgi:hypothetical protein